MIPTLYILPHAQLKLRRQSCDVPLREGPLWVLSSLDERARCLWEVVLPTPALRNALHALAEGQTSVSTGRTELAVSADPAAEASTISWALRELSAHADALGTDATPAVAERAHLRLHRPPSRV